MRNQCPACGECFNSIAAFDRHRTGRFGVARRCLTPDEMRAQGMALSARGFWITRRDVRRHNGPANLKAAVVAPRSRGPLAAPGVPVAGAFLPSGTAGSPLQNRKVLPAPFEKHGNCAPRAFPSSDPQIL
jgi:hypothetical protein